jgi:2-dehydropantoate 2-reductase
MNICVIGAGAMGSLFGALLAEAGKKVTLFDVRQDHVDAINADGLTVEKEETSRNIRISATTDIHRIGPTDLCLIFVKSTHTADTAETAGLLAGQTGLVLTLQNGMGNADILCGWVDASRVIAGTTSHGATFLQPGVIRHAGSGDTFIGPWEEKGLSGANRVADLFSLAGINTLVKEDVRSVLWSKLLINVGINAVTALTGIKNGQLLDLDQTRQLCRDAVNEAATVARMLGVNIAGDPVQTVFNVAKATGANRSSMGQDVDNRRLTEIGAINGYIVKMAKQAGIPVPINRTLTSLVETLQSHY